MNCTLTPEGIWKKRISVALSAEERTLIYNRAPEASVSRRALQQTIADRTNVPCTETESAALQALYTSHALADHTLIAVDIETDIPAGIINCRSPKGTHVQVRF